MASSSSLSNPGSPMLAQRSFSLERGRYNNLEPVQQEQQAQRMVLTRQKSDLSHDRERPFVAVKRAHEQHLKSLNMTHNGGGQVHTISKPKKIRKMGGDFFYIECNSINLFQKDFKVGNCMTTGCLKIPLL